MTDGLADNEPPDDGGFMRLTLGLLLACVWALPVSAQTYKVPVGCTAQHGFSVRCCASSYARAPQGAMDETKRHADLAACTKKDRSKKKKV
jgi:hypothetical protein